MSKLPSRKSRRSARTFALAFPLLLLSSPVVAGSPAATLWTVPSILIASMLITWGAESAQFFVAQGFALAILAWMQTLPEFAVEAVIAWRQQIPLMLANLTGALRLLTGLAWPLIYITAAVVHRRRTRQPLRSIVLRGHHSIEVAGLIFPLLYALVICWKASLNVYDAAVLVALYAAYLALLTRMPAEQHEGIQDLAAVPRRIVLAPRARRNLAILFCFGAGGLLIYLTAEPFLGSLIAVAVAIGIPTFIVIQWFAPVISEFPELASTFYFARQEENASVALMNIASSNINQWTLLFAMLPVVFSMSRGTPSTIDLDAEQRSELLLTIGQSLVALTFLLNMQFAWWEALAMFCLFAIQFVLPAFFGEGIRVWITYAFFFWVAAAVIRMLAQRRRPAALEQFIQTWQSVTASRTE
jgi:cation:H+ antiporter